MTEPFNVTAGRCNTFVSVYKDDVLADCVAPATTFDGVPQTVHGSGKQASRELFLGLLRHRWSAEKTRVELARIETKDRKK